MAPDPSLGDNAPGRLNFYCYDPDALTFGCDQSKYENQPLIIAPELFEGEKEPESETEGSGTEDSENTEEKQGETEDPESDSFLADE